MTRPKEMKDGKHVTMYLDSVTCEGFNKLSTLVNGKVNQSEGARLSMLFMSALSTGELVKMVKRLQKLKEKK